MGWEYGPGGYRVWIDPKTGQAGTPPAVETKVKRTTNRYGGPRGTKKDRYGNPWSVHQGKDVGGRVTSQKPKATKKDKPAKADRRAQAESEKAARQAELEAAAQAAGITIEQQARYDKLNAQWQAEARARLKGEADTQASFEASAKSAKEGAAQVLRRRQRRRAKLRQEDASGAALDAIADKIRQARQDRKARREAYRNIAMRAKLARTRLQQARDAQRKNPKGRLPATEMADPRTVLGLKKDGNTAGEKDPGLQRETILQEIRDIRKRQRESGGSLLDTERLKALDQRLDWMVSRLSDKLARTIKEAEKLEKAARKGDRVALKRLEDLLAAEETKRIFKQREFFFGRKDGEIGVFDRYYANRRVISNRYHDFWTNKLQTAASNQWHANNAQARGQGLLRRQLMSVYGMPQKEGASLDAVRPDSQPTPDQIPLNPDGSWSEAPPEEIAKFLTASLLQRAVQVNPGVRLYSKIATGNANRMSNLHTYVLDASRAAGIPFESFEFTDPHVVDQAVDAATAQFRQDWEAKNGKLEDTGVDVAGLFNFSLASDDAKRQSDAYRAAEEQFKNDLYQLYQDRKSPGVIEDLLGQWVMPLVIQVADIASGAWGGFWGDMQGLQNAPTTKPPTLAGFKHAKNKQELIAEGYPEWLLSQAPDDFSFQGMSDAEIQPYLDEANRYSDFGQNVGPSLNILNPAVWAGGPHPDEAEAWAREHDLPMQEFMENGKFSLDKYRNWLSQHKDIQRQYFTDYPSAQGLITGPEDQLNANPDSKIVYQNGFDQFFGFGKDVGRSSQLTDYSEKKTFAEDFVNSAPGQSALDHFWDQVRLLNESPNFLQREPGGGGLATARLASMLADPLMLAKPARVARIFQYGIEKGDGFLSAAGLISRQLYEHRFGFSIPGRRYFGIPELNAAPDTVGRWLDAKKLPKELRKAFENGDRFTEKEMQQLLDSYIERTGVDPIREARGGFKGFLADVERQFGPMKINNKQIQAASERYVKRALAREGVQVIERADQASLRRRAAKLRDAADAEDAAAARRVAEQQSESRARKAIRNAEAKRQAETGAKKRSILEAADDFVEGASDDLGRAAGDFRSPVAHRIEGGYAVRFYRRGLTKAKESASVFGMGTTRHAEDIIAVADGIARRYGLGVRWIRSPKHLSAGKPRAIVELFGGTPEQMAKAADELDILMRKHRLGVRTKNATYRALDPSDGRVLFRDRFKDAVREEASIQGQPIGIAEHRLLEKVRLRRSQLARLRQIKNKDLVKQLGDLQDKIDNLDQAARAGDSVASREQAKLYKQAMEIESKIGRIERLEDRIVTRQRQMSSTARNGIGPLDAAQSEALLKQLGETRNWIESQLRIARMRLSKDPNNKALRSYIDWLEQAKLGQRLLAEDLAGPVHVSKKVVKAHSDEARILQRIQRTHAAADCPGEATGWYDPAGLWPHGHRTRVASEADPDDSLRPCRRC